MFPAVDSGSSACVVFFVMLLGDLSGTTLEGVEAVLTAVDVDGAHSCKSSIVIDGGRNGLCGVRWN